MKRRPLLSPAGGALLLPTLASAQDKYPSKVITWICPCGASGNADARSHQVAKLMQGVQGVQGQAIILDNKAGGGGNTGTNAIARATPDGYIVGMGDLAPLAVNHALFKKLSFDPLNGLLPIRLIERGPLILMVHTDSPNQSVKDVVAGAKAAPGKLTYAPGGIGGTHHLSGALFEPTAGIDMTHVPYKSDDAAANDLMGGQMDTVCEQRYAAMPSIKTGRLRPQAITSKTRLALAPEIPPVGEASVPGVEVLNWQGLDGPKGLPAETVRILNAAGNEVLQEPEQRKRMLAQGNQIGGGAPAQFAALNSARRFGVPGWSTA